MSTSLLGALVRAPHPLISLDGVEMGLDWYKGILVADMGMEMGAFEYSGNWAPASEGLWVRFEVLRAAARMGSVRGTCTAPLGHLAYS